MSQMTKRALVASLKELMVEKPLDKITVTDLTEHCGVNRMTFYYHFKDIYDLVEWACVEEATRALAGKKTYDTWQQGFLQILQSLQKDKVFYINVYHSISREYIEQYLYKLTYDLMIGVVEERAAAQGAQVIPVCAKLEAEIAELDAEEKKMFLDDLGVAESGLDRLVKASYTLLGLISYLTSGEDECRAWTIVKGTKAPQAAGKIHSDFERGFIRAEVVSYEDLMACGTMAAAREKGLIRSEGKEYVVQDGDIILFRFNV